MAQDVVYVTDLSIFTVLAPCAASAISYNVQSQTYDNCPEAVTELQSCVCERNNNFDAVSRGISRSVSYSCGSTASEDLASAVTVLNAYCNQNTEVSFPEPETSVSQYITDLPAFEDLAPCAASGLSYIVHHLATCVCNKNQNSLLASAGINTSVRYSCSSNTADISSAQAVFAGYCGLNNGTSSFPETSGPPGDMTYYITALDEYSALAPCARSALSYNVFSQTYDLCPGGPQALASCVCLKNGMSRLLTNLIPSSVRYSCESTASEDVSSALEVFDYYCSAAEALVTPGGITESVSQTARTGNTALSGPAQTAAPTSSDSGDLGLGGSGSGSGSGDSNSDSSGSDSGSGSEGSSEESSDAQPASSNTGVIVGALVGVIGGLAFIAAVVFFIWRRSRKAKAQAQAGANGGPDAAAGAGKPELDNTIAAAPVSPPDSSSSPNALKAQLPSRVDNVSPVSAHNASELNAQPTGPKVSELHAQGTTGPVASRTELQGQNLFPTQTATAHFPMNTPYSPGGHGVQEAYGQQVYEAPVQHPAQVHEMHGQPSTNWQSGPVPQYHEMDGGLHQSRAP